MEHETFWSLVKSLPHWEFELLLMALFDGLLGAIILPWWKRAHTHHQSDDQRIEALERELDNIKSRLGIKEKS